MRTWRVFAEPDTYAIVAEMVFKIPKNSANKVSLLISFLIFCSMSVVASTDIYVAMK